MNDIPRQTLCTIIRDYGRDVADDPKRCKGLLLDLCGEHRREINILISAMNEGVASDLLNSSPNTPHQIVLPQLVLRLVDNLAMDESAAQWVVETWALALGVIAESALMAQRERQEREQRERQERGQRESKARKEQKHKARVEREQEQRKLYDGRHQNPANPDYWCHVNTGSFWYGDEDCSELRQMQMNYSFKIARFPLTNAEYARFLDAGGYQERRWWTAQEWSRKKEQGWTAPREWNNSLYNQPDQPVVCISWYEAVAYCTWVTAQGHTEGWLSAGEEIRLPTSLEWERAARHTDQRRYPWGNEHPTVKHVNAAESGIDAPSPVGCYPQGAAVCGAQDMLGNVWEWTSTQWTRDWEIQPRRSLGTDDQVIVRGGAYYTKLEHLRYPSRASYDLGSVNLGVRLIRLFC